MDAMESIQSIIKMISSMYKGFIEEGMHPDVAMELTKHFITTLIINQKQEMSVIFPNELSNA